MVEKVRLGNSVGRRFVIVRPLCRRRIFVVGRDQLLRVNFVSRVRVFTLVVRRVVARIALVLRETIYVGSFRFWSRHSVNSSGMGRVEQKVVVVDVREEHPAAAKSFYFQRVEDLLGGFSSWDLFPCFETLKVFELILRNAFATREACSDQSAHNRLVLVLVWKTRSLAMGSALFRIFFPDTGRKIDLHLNLKKSREGSVSPNHTDPQLFHLGLDLVLKIERVGKFYFVPPSTIETNGDSTVGSKRQK